jgi:hypothetical protein
VEEETREVRELTVALRWGRGLVLSLRQKINSVKYTRQLSCLSHHCGGMRTESLQLEFEELLHHRNLIQGLTGGGGWRGWLGGEV